MTGGGSGNGRTWREPRDPGRMNDTLEGYDMTNYSTGAHELALTIINDGTGYKERCNIARDLYERPTAAGTQNAATMWVSVATRGARAYEKDFGSPGASSFTVTDILEAAAELAEYYEQHIKEF